MFIFLLHFVMLHVTKLMQDKNENVFLFFLRTVCLKLNVEKVTPAVVIITKTGESCILSLPNENAL